MNVAKKRNAQLALAAYDPTRFDQNMLAGLQAQGGTQAWLAQQNIQGVQSNANDTSAALVADVENYANNDYTAGELLQIIDTSSDVKEVKKAINKIFSYVGGLNAAAGSSIGKVYHDSKLLAKIKKESIDLVQKAVAQFKKKELDKIIMTAKKSLAARSNLTISELWPSSAGGGGGGGGLREYRYDPDGEWTMEDAAQAIEDQRDEMKNRAAQKGTYTNPKTIAKMDALIAYMKDPANTQKIMTPSSFAAKKSRLTQATEWTDPKNLNHVDYNPMELAGYFFGPQFKKEAFDKYEDGQGRLKRFPKWAMSNEVDEMYQGAKDDNYVVHTKNQEIKAAFNKILAIILGPDSASRIKLDPMLIEVIRRFYDTYDRKFALGLVNSYLALESGTKNPKLKMGLEHLMHLFASPEGQKTVKSLGLGSLQAAADVQVAKIGNWLKTHYDEELSMADEYGRFFGSKLRTKKNPVKTLQKLSAQDRTTYINDIIESQWATKFSNMDAAKVQEIEQTTIGELISNMGKARFIKMMNVPYFEAWRAKKAKAFIRRGLNMQEAIDAINNDPEVVMWNTLHIESNTQQRNNQGPLTYNQAIQNQDLVFSSQNQANATKLALDNVLAAYKPVKATKLGVADKGYQSLYNTIAKYGRQQVRTSPYYGLSQMFGSFCILQLERKRNIQILESALGINEVQYSSLFANLDEVISRFEALVLSPAGLDSIMSDIVTGLSGRNVPSTGLYVHFTFLMLLCVLHGASTYTDTADLVAKLDNDSQKKIIKFLNNSIKTNQLRVPKGLDSDIATRIFTSTKQELQSQQRNIVRNINREHTNNMNGSLFGFAVDQLPDVIYPLLGSIAFSPFFELYTMQVGVFLQAVRQTIDDIMQQSIIDQSNVQYLPIPNLTAISQWAQQNISLTFERENQGFQRKAWTYTKEEKKANRKTQKRINKAFNQLTPMINPDLGLARMKSKNFAQFQRTEPKLYPGLYIPQPEYAKRKAWQANIDKDQLQNIGGALNLSGIPENKFAQ